MSVHELMTKSPLTCAPTDSLARAAQIMWESDCGVVPVVDAKNRVVGMVTDRDACMAAYTRGETLASIRVADAMSKQVFSCSPDAAIDRARGIMETQAVRRLPVVDGLGQLVGLLSLNDLARAAGGERGDGVASKAAVAHTLAAIGRPRQAPPVPQLAVEPARAARSAAPRAATTV